MYNNNVYRRSVATSDKSILSPDVQTTRILKKFVWKIALNFTRLVFFVLSAPKFECTLILLIFRVPIYHYNIIHII